MAAILVMRYAPETKGLTLEEVQQIVGGPASTPASGTAFTQELEADR